MARSPPPATAHDRRMQKVRDVCMDLSEIQPFYHRSRFHQSVVRPLQVNDLKLAFIYHMRFRFVEDVCPVAHPLLDHATRALPSSLPISPQLFSNIARKFGGFIARFSRHFSMGI